MEIRLAELNDSPGIARLSGTLGYPTSENEIASRLSFLLKSEKHIVVVATGDDGTIRGWIAAELRLILESGERAEIVGMVVDPFVRRMGIGKTLLVPVENWARDHGMSTIVVKSNVTRIESHSFFENARYIRSKTQSVYRKELAEPKPCGEPV